MNTEVFQRVCTGKFASYYGPRSKGEIVEASRTAFVVYCQNIYDWLWSQRPFTLPELSPRFKLPFPCMFFEYRDHIRTDRTVGILFENLPETDKDPACVQAHVCFEKYHALTFLFYTDDDLRLSDNISMRLAATGDHNAETLERCQTEADSLAETGCRDETVDLSLPAIAAVSFFHCRNVTIKTVDRSPKLVKKFKRKHKGVELPSFHVIEVHRPTRHTESSADSKSSIERRANFVRGHFKTYAEDAKLFGKIAGMWFWQMHVRGAGDQPLRSEYRAWPPSPRHRRNCVIEIP